jgi:hypothetical protein
MKLKEDLEVLDQLELNMKNTPLIDKAKDILTKDDEHRKYVEKVTITKRII